MRKHKYNAKAIIIDGIRFDSTKEGKRYTELKYCEKAGAIQNLQLQIPYELVPKTDKFRAVKYILDFQYKEVESGDMIYEDVKGLRKGAAYQMFKIKQKMMYHLYKIEVSEI